MLAFMIALLCVLVVYRLATSGGGAVILYLGFVIGLIALAFSFHWILGIIVFSGAFSLLASMLS